MRIIVCGVGLMGRGIVRQLVSEEHSVTVIDRDPEQITAITQALDVSAIHGLPSHPSILEEAGAQDAEMIIAVTTSDETNMIICQIAHSIFNVPIKIARIRHADYLRPEWSDLYRTEHLPIDYIISPEREVASAIINRLHVPGAMDCLSFGQGRIRVVEVRCNEDNISVGLSTAMLKEQQPELQASMLAIWRGEALIVPEENTRLEAGDEVFFAVPEQQLPQLMMALGHHEHEARRIVIIGGGNIGFYIAQALEEEGQKLNTKLIEIEKTRAEFVAANLKRTTVICGSALDRQILTESNIAQAETLIAVTNDDEVNILASLLAKRGGCQRVFTLTNKSKSYGALMSSLGIDVMVNPREMTVAGILLHTRKGKFTAVHSICSGQAELMGISIPAHAAVTGKTIGEVGLPKETKVGMMLRGDNVIIPDQDTLLAEEDHLLIVSDVRHVTRLDDIFSARLDYF